MVPITPYEVFLEDILKHKNKSRKSWDYSNGGFYAIVDTENNKTYIGKSVLLMNRLRDHIRHAEKKSGLYIDLVMHGRIEKFKFFVLLEYKNLGIDFFSRKLETTIEKHLVRSLKSYHPHGYNIQYSDNRLYLQQGLLGLCV